MAIGDPVLALGNPFALSSSVTLGIVSNAHRVFTDFTGSELSDVELEDGGTTGWLTQWIQHDALILPGNSGGPLVNLSGEVIGINELGSGGIGFAIPARVAADVLRHALADGTVRRSFLGFAALPVAKLGRDSGALVSSVTKGGPAERAGLAAGDILLTLNGEEVEARFFEQVPELYRRIAALPIGADATLGVERLGVSREIVARTAEMERMRGERGELRILGISAEELTGPLALARNLPVREGLLVTGLRPGQAAATARPQVVAGDVLVAIDGHPVTTLAAVEERLAVAESGGAIGAARGGWRHRAQASAWRPGDSGAGALAGIAQRKVGWRAAASLVGRPYSGADAGARGGSRATRSPRLPHQRGLSVDQRGEVRAESWRSTRSARW